MYEKADAFLVRQPKKDPHSVTKCKEGKFALESFLVTYVKNKSASEVATFTVEWLRVFWALLEGNQKRGESQDTVFDNGEEALKSDGAILRVVKTWLSQSKSAAARIANKTSSEAPAAKKQKQNQEEE